MERSRPSTLASPRRPRSHNSLNPSPPTPLQQASLQELPFACPSAARASLCFFPLCRLCALPFTSLCRTHPPFPLPEPDVLCLLRLFPPPSVCTASARGCRRDVGWSKEGRGRGGHARASLVSSVSSVFSVVVLLRVLPLLRRCLPPSVSRLERVVFLFQPRCTAPLRPGAPSSSPWVLGGCLHACVCLCVCV